MHPQRLGEPRRRRGPERQNLERAKRAKRKLGRRLAHGRLPREDTEQQAERAVASIRCSCIRSSDLLCRAPGRSNAAGATLLLTTLNLLAQSDGAAAVEEYRSERRVCEKGLAVPNRSGGLKARRPTAYE
jgi:hypothetical protein